MNSKVTFVHGLLYVDTPVLVDQQCHIHHLCTNARCSPENTPGPMDCKEELRESGNFDLSVPPEYIYKLIYIS